MTAIPALTNRCNSWICEAPEGHPGYRGSRFVEVWEIRDAAMLAEHGWTVRTALDHLARLNEGGAL